MSDDFSLAERLFGKGRSEEGARSPSTSKLYGTATGDSSGGFVSVEIEGNVTAGDGDDASLVFPTSPAVREGDAVEIELTGGVAKAPLVVNVPGWGDRVADIAEQAEAAAAEAAATAAATSQFFWENDSDPETYGGSGVHITNETKDEWVESVASGFPDIETHPHHNVLINSMGILMRRALKNLVSITRNAIAFFDGEGNEAGNVVASFGASGAQIGPTDSQHAVLGASGLNVYDGNGDLMQINSVDLVAVRDAAEEALDDAAAAAQAAQDAQTSAGAAAESAGAAAASASTASENAAQAISDAAAASQAAATADAKAEQAIGDAASASNSAYEAAQSAHDATVNLAITQQAVENLGADVGDLKTHVAMFDDGLHVVPLDNGYYIVLSPTSMQVRDPLGNVVSEYGEGIRLGRLSGTHMVATGDRLSFETADGSEVAYIAVDAETGDSMFYMTKAVVVKDLRFGQWKWADRANGNLALKWVGAIEEA